MKKILCSLILALALAALPGVKISQSLSGEKELHVGDRFQLNIRADVGLKNVTLPDTLTIFKVLGQERIAKPDSLAYLRVTIVPLFPGSHIFPRLDVVPDDPDGAGHHTDRFRVYVIPVREAQDSLLVDIKPLDRYPWQLPLWVYPLLLALMLSLILISVLLRMKNKPRSPKPAPETLQLQPATIPDPAWKQALRELEELIGQQLIAQGDYVQHHFGLSYILRQFVESKYRFTAREMTTSEIRWVAQRIHVERSEEVLRFLSFCDLVKFARYIPSADEVENAEVWLRGWLMSFEVLEAQQKLASGGQRP